MIGRKASTITHGRCPNRIARESTLRPSRVTRKPCPFAANRCLPDHLMIAESLNNLGVVQMELREYASAKKQSHAEALAIRRKSYLPVLYRSRKASTTWASSNGNCVSTLRPSRVIRRPWPFAANPCSPDHPGIANSLTNLSFVCLELREYAAAKQSHTEALSIRRKSLPPDHPDIPNSLNNLSARVTPELRESTPRPSRVTWKPWPSAANPCLPTIPISQTALTIWVKCQMKLGDQVAAQTGSAT